MGSITIQASPIETVQTDVDTQGLVLIVETLRALLTVNRLRETRRLQTG